MFAYFYLVVGPLGFLLQLVVAVRPRRRFKSSCALDARLDWFGMFVRDCGGFGRFKIEKIMCTPPARYVRTWEGSECLLGIVVVLDVLRLKTCVPSSCAIELDLVQLTVNLLKFH